MDRRDRLGQACARAHAAGDELLQVLRDPVTPEVVDRVVALVNARDESVQEAVGLFAAGDEAQFGSQLQVLLRQQRALEAEMRRFMDELAHMSEAAAQVRSTVLGARRIIDVGRRGRMLDQRR